MERLCNYDNNYQAIIENKNVVVKVKNGRHIVKVSADLEKADIESDLLNNVVNSINEETSDVFFYINGSFLCGQINVKEKIAGDRLKQEIESLIASINSIIFMLEVENYDKQR